MFIYVPHARAYTLVTKSKQQRIYKFIAMLSLCVFDGDLVNRIILWSSSIYILFSFFLFAEDKKKQSFWQREFCIWHIIAAQSLLPTKSHHPNQIKTRFPLQTIFEHSDRVILTSFNLLLFLYFLLILFFFFFGEMFMGQQFSSSLLLWVFV